MSKANTHRLATHAVAMIFFMFPNCIKYWESDEESLKVDMNDGGVFTVSWRHVDDEKGQYITLEYKRGQGSVSYIIEDYDYLVFVLSWISDLYDDDQCRECLEMCREAEELRREVLA